MKVAVFTLRPHAVTHQFGTELEVVLDHVDRGDDVHVILCNSTNHLCDSNISNYIPEVCLGHYGIQGKTPYSYCFECILVRETWFSRLGLRERLGESRIHELNSFEKFMFLSSRILMSFLSFHMKVLNAD